MESWALPHMGYELATQVEALSKLDSDQTVCSKYLISGLYGVDDAAITDSNSYVSHVTRLPMTQARLFYYDFDHNGKEIVWKATVNDRQQYIQVKFPREAVLDIIMLQGCEIPDRWVSTYFLHYSMDGITWTTVTSNNKPKLFHGNNNSLETSVTTLNPEITALYLRINPQSWHGHISMRFDVSGCYKVKKDPFTKTTYVRLPTPPYDALKSMLIAESKSATFQACGRMCHERTSCVSFTIDAHRMFCQVYSNIVFSKHGSTINPSGGVSYFVRNVADPALGFRHIPGEIFKYKVNEIEINQQKAIDVCQGYQSQLVRIDSETKMKYLQSVIYGNNILSMLNTTLIVSGTYDYPKWIYNAKGPPIEINSALWSPGNPNPSNGHCVGLMKTGLASIKCSERFFSICESF
ncbi:uncharacterized protein [Argopecten irradians]|uniref:uncharacterized protein n=1 Tax=Argopecten irradians TaxID=31199 RepID=UPI00371F06B7